MSKPLTFAYIDYYNLMFRTAHMSGKMSDLDDKLGMMMHSMLHSILYLKSKLHVDHVIVCCDRSSWRKDIYPEYKLNRITKRLKKTIKEQEEDDAILSAAQELFEFLRGQTRLPCVRVEKAEADDVIATMIADNPDAHHIIVSTDSDFYQLVTPSVMIFNPTDKKYITIHGFFDDKFVPIEDNKTGKQKTLGTPEWALFLKCIRGDSSDNIKTAYPRVRTKGTKNKVGLMEAFEDRDSRSYAWFSIMEHEWEDGFGNKHLVRDLYERNRALIDLKNTPDDIKHAIRLDVIEQLEKAERMKASEVGFAFTKYCSKWSLYSVYEKAGQFVEII